MAPAERDSAATNHIDLERTPKNLAETIWTIASNAVHLARPLQKQPYPAP